MMMYRMMGNSWGNWDSMPDYMKDMMQGYYGGTRSLWGFSGLMDFVVQVLIIVLLIAAIRWLWKKGDKV